MKKQDWDDEFLEMLSLFELKSKCRAKKVACIITRNNNVISIGLNGTLPGRPNCNDVFYRNDKREWFKVKGCQLIRMNKEDCDDSSPSSHHQWSLLNEIHAEQNAIYKATQEMNANIAGSTVYITYCPCVNCAKMLALYKVKRIVYKYSYDNEENVIDFLKSVGIEVVKYERSK